MAPKKFMRWDTVLAAAREIVATVTSAGAANAGDIVALDDSGRLDASVMPVGFGDDRQTVQASEALTAGDWVNIFDTGSPVGTFRVRKADASTTGKEAHGYVLANVTSGSQAIVFGEGNNTQVTGQVPGRVFLSAANAGKTVSTPPTVSGGIQQPLGVATSATNINVEIDQPVILA